MDNSQKLNGLLNVIPTFGSKKMVQVNLSSKNKRYVQQVEKALASFDTLEEWADYIAFLSRLQKSLQLHEKELPPHSLDEIVHGDEVASKLALCMSPTLPNGVHQKALSIYESIFRALSEKALNRKIYVWLPGILPILSYCSIQLKPQVLRIYKGLLSQISGHSLRYVTEPLILAILSGLDDVNSEIFNSTFELLDTLKAKYGGNCSHFWLCMFLCILSHPERRIGALNWCNKRLPELKAIKSGKEIKFSEECQACLSPDPGLLVRAFASAVNTSTVFNPSNDIIVIRGFFDLLITHLPLDGEVLNKIVSEKDKKMLIKACSKVTLRKDMSLNKRLWNWFLGPDKPDIDSSISATTPQKSARASFFKQHALDYVKSNLLDTITGEESQSKKAEAIKILQSFILDKWEISHLLTPILLTPILTAYYNESKNQKTRDSNEFLRSVEAFFNGVETSYIWYDINKLILLGTEEAYDLLMCIFESFDFNDEEIRSLHVQLSIILLLSVAEINGKWTNVMELLFNLTIPQSFVSPKLPDGKCPSLKEASHLIQDFYYSNIIDEPESFNLDQKTISYIIFNNFEEILIARLQSPFSERLCKLFCQLLYALPDSDEVNWSGSELCKELQGIPCYQEKDSIERMRELLSISLGVSYVFIRISKSLSVIEKKKIFKVILTNLWPSFASPLPVNSQVESVKIVFDLGMCVSKDDIIAGISSLVISSPIYEALRAISTLWTHSLLIKDADYILQKPLCIVFDVFMDPKDYTATAISDFLLNLVKTGSISRLFKILVTQLIEFPFMESNISDLKTEFDLEKFSYLVRTLSNCLKNGTKNLKDSFNNELVGLEDGKGFEVIQKNKWEVSTYKKLTLNLLDKFFRLKLSGDFQQNKKDVLSYFASIDDCLDLYVLLLSGNEADFIEWVFVLINACAFLSANCESSFNREVIEKKFLNVISGFFKLSNSLKLNFHFFSNTSEDENKEQLLIKFIVLGIDRCESSTLLNGWIDLLKSSLYIFNDSIFKVIFSLNDTLIKKLEYYFSLIRDGTYPNDLTNIEESISILALGLEDLISISHSYLLTSSLKELKENKGVPNNEGGFFGYMIQGVFQLESPTAKSTEENKLYSILLSVHDSTKVCYDLWRWADSFVNNQRSAITSEKSLMYFMSKIKFRSRNLLETLIELERKEVIETIVGTQEIDSGVKLLQILDGGLPQMTLPHILDSIVFKLCPSILDNSKKLYSTSNTTSKMLLKFLVRYTESMDNDSVPDLWAYYSSFFKDIVLHFSHFKDDIGHILVILKILLLKLNLVSYAEQRKHKKEFVDYYVKIIALIFATKTAVVSSDSTQAVEDVKQGSLSSNSSSEMHKEILDSIEESIKYFQDMIQDNDKIASCINVILVNIVSQHTKSKKYGELPPQVFHILELVGEYHPVKYWRLLIADIFFDSSFFEMSGDDLKRWVLIIKYWSALEKEKVSELFVKINLSSLSAATNIFAWNENSEIRSKIAVLKRVTYLVLCQEKDYYLTEIEDTFRSVAFSINQKTLASYRRAILDLIRALVLRFSEQHMLPFWVVIHQHLRQAFSLILRKDPKEISKLGQEEAGLILGACKLLDLLLLCNFDEFGLNEWLYVSSDPDVINKHLNDSALAIIDKISLQNRHLVLSESAIQVERPQGTVRPLLNGIRNVNNVSILRSFFDSLSLISFERVYNGLHVDFRACEADVINDL